MLFNCVKFMSYLIPTQSTDHSQRFAIENNEIIPKAVSQGDSVATIQEKLLSQMRFKYQLQSFYRLILRFFNNVCHDSTIKNGRFQ